MEAYSVGKAVGLAAGLLVGVIVSIFAIRYMNRDSKLRTKYDERQEMARGRAYRYGFWGMMIATAVVIILDCAGIVLVSSFTKGFFIIFVGIIVQISYSIFNDAYYGLNTNKKRFMIICIIAGLANLVNVIGNIAGNTFIKDGIVSDAGTNLLCVIMLFVMAIEMFVKGKMDENAVTEESEE